MGFAESMLNPDLSSNRQQQRIKSLKALLPHPIQQTTAPLKPTGHRLIIMFPPCRFGRLRCPTMEP